MGCLPMTAFMRTGFNTPMSMSNSSKAATFFMIATASVRRVVVWTVMFIKLFAEIRNKARTGEETAQPANEGYLPRMPSKLPSDAKSSSHGSINVPSSKLVVVLESIRKTAPNRQHDVPSLRPACVTVTTDRVGVQEQTAVFRATRSDRRAPTSTKWRKRPR